MSICSQLSTSLKNLQSLHQNLADVLVSLNEEFTEENLKQAKELRAIITKTTKSLEQELKTSTDRVLKEKLKLNWNEQIAALNDRNQEDWADDINNARHNILTRLKSKENRFAIQEKIKAGMIPILMPGKSQQRKNWKQSLTNLKPYWREPNKKTGIMEEKIVNDGYFWSTAYGELLTQDAAWNTIPEEPYIVWTHDSQDVLPETKKLSKDAQLKLIQKNHAIKPELYDATELHPLEYVSLQAIHTYNALQQTKEKGTNQSVLPFDYWGLKRNDVETYSYTRFPSCGLSSGGGVLNANFNPVRAKVDFNDYDPAAGVDFGFRSAGRL